jgi:hypothetical protein
LEGTLRRLSIVFLVQLARHSESILNVLDEESATGDEPSKMLIVAAWQRPGASRLGKIGREIIPDSGRRGQIIDMFLKARDPCTAVKGAEGVWMVCLW